jgi:pSer/pThr/pTyr-binding forkhead associated (FHA) protein
MKCCLRVVRADGTKETIKVAEDHAVYAGRVPSYNEEDNIIVDSHESVSRRHAKFTTEGQNVILVDCGSSNSTYLNGKAVIPNKEYTLEEGDEVRLADSQTTIRLKKSKESKEERTERSRSRSRDEPVTEVSESTKKMLKALDKYKTRDEKVKFLKLMGHKNAEKELDSL